jgi:hypothetical protein
LHLSYLRQYELVSELIPDSRTLTTI